MIATPQGQAWVDLDLNDSDRVIVLGHGAGGSVDAPDLLAVREACLARGVSVARVTQPYRVAGRRAPPAAAALDSAWCSVLADLLAGPLASRKPRQLIVGGRSSGARVACRCTIEAAVGVVALAFPLHPPGKPDKTRAAELDLVRLPLLVVQGRSDPFGMPEQVAGRTVATVLGDHSLRRSAGEVGELVAEWICRLA